MAYPDPTAELPPPADPSPSLTGGYIDLFGFMDIISPTSWINEFITEVTGVDPLGTLTQTFAGDWASFARCGEAWGNLARFSAQLSANIQSGAWTLDGRWDGHAADAAIAYFSDLASAVGQMRAPLQTAADQYADCARGMWELATEAQSLLQGLVDDVIIAELAAAVGTSLVETGVGAVAGYGVAAVQIAGIIEKVGRLTQICATADVIVFSVFGGGMALAYQGGHLTGRPLPDAPYHHPATP